MNLALQIFGKSSFIDQEAFADIFEDIIGRYQTNSPPGYLMIQSANCSSDFQTVG